MLCVLAFHEYDFVVCFISRVPDLINPKFTIRRHVVVFREIFNIALKCLAGFGPLCDSQMHQKLTTTKNRRSETACACCLSSFFINFIQRGIIDVLHCFAVRNPRILFVVFINECWSCALVTNLNPSSRKTARSSSYPTHLGSQRLPTVTTNIFVATYSLKLPSERSHRFRCLFYFFSSTTSASMIGPSSFFLSSDLASPPSGCGWPPDGPAPWPFSACAFAAAAL